MTKELRLRRFALILFPLTLLGCRHALSLPAHTFIATTTTTEHEQIAPDIQVRALFDARKRAPYVALDFPKMVKASAATFLNEREYVLGITAGGESRAYPTRFMKFHHVVNDNIGQAAGRGTPVAVTYCVVCNTGVRYDPVVQGKRLQFDFYGIYNGIAALYERQTEGVFLLAEGRIVTGPLTGTRLKTGSLLDTTWGHWKRLHPDTLVMSPETPFKKWYGTANDPIERSSTGFPMPMFGPTVTRGDLRLAPFDTVLAVTYPADKEAQAPLHRAYPFHTLQQAGGVVNDTLGNAPVGVLLDTKTLTAAALSRKLGAQTLTLETRREGDGETAFYDRETGTRWNLEGKGEAGPLKGKELERLNNHLSQWYGWAASFPDTSIYGRTDLPQPGNPFQATEAP